MSTDTPSPADALALAEIIEDFLDNPRASPGALVFRSGKTLQPAVLEQAATTLRALLAAQEAQRVRIGVLEGAVQGLLYEWDKFTRYGSPLAKAANERVAFARQALSAATAGEAS